MRSKAAAAHSEKKARRRSSVMWIAPAGGGAGSSGETSEDCFSARLARRGLRLLGLTSGAPVAAGGAGGAAEATGASVGWEGRRWRGSSRRFRVRIEGEARVLVAEGDANNRSAVAIFGKVRRGSLAGGPGKVTLETSFSRRRRRRFGGRRRRRFGGLLIRSGWRRISCRSGKPTAQSRRDGSAGRLLWWRRRLRLALGRAICGRRRWSGRGGGNARNIRRR